MNEILWRLDMEDFGVTDRCPLVSRLASMMAAPSFSWSRQQGDISRTRCPATCFDCLTLTYYDLYSSGLLPYFVLAASFRFLHKTPLSFDPSMEEVFMPLVCGASLVIAKPDGHRDMSYIAKLIHKKHITAAYFVPAQLPYLVGELAKGVGHGCRTLRTVAVSGEVLPPLVAQSLLKQLPQISLWNLYGPTEATINVTAFRVERLSKPALAPISIGTPSYNTHLLILDSHMQPVPIGVPGQLFISGVMVARGYKGREELTANSFLPNPWSGGDSSYSRMYKTGDLARWLPDGNIDFLGRADKQGV